MRNLLVAGVAEKSTWLWPKVKRALFFGRGYNIIVFFALWGVVFREDGGQPGVAEWVTERSMTKL